MRRMCNDNNWTRIYWSPFSVFQLNFRGSPKNLIINVSKSSCHATITVLILIILATTTTNASLCLTVLLLLCSVQTSCPSLSRRHIKVRTVGGWGEACVWYGKRCNESRIVQRHLSAWLSALFANTRRVTNSYPLSSPQETQQVCTTDLHINNCNFSCHICRNSSEHSRTVSWQYDFFFIFNVFSPLPWLALFASIMMCDVGILCTL